MTLRITSDLIGTENDATRETRLAALTDGYFGAGAYAGAANLGGVRALLNPMLTTPIANGEAFGSWLTKFNALNSPVARVAAAIFTGANDVLFDFTDPVGNFADTGGTVQITHNTPLARANSLVNGVNHQQATTSLRGLWMTDATGGWYRPDGSDDLFTFALPSAVTGTLCLIGKDACYFESRDAALGATVNVGWSGSEIKNGTAGLSSVLDDVGDVLAIGFVEGTLTSDEKLHIARAFRPFGGGGILTLGAELLINGTFDTDLTGWTTLLGTVAWDATAARCTSNGTQVGRMAQTLTGSFTGKRYQVSGRCVSVSGGAMIGQMYPSTVAGQGGNLGIVSLLPGITARRAYTFTADTIYVLAQSNGNTAGFSALIDDLSVRPLIVEPL